MIRHHHTPARRVRVLRALLFATVATVAPLHAAAAEVDDDLAIAVTCYERGDWAAALEPLERAARAGDRRAQEMAGFMRWLGPALYGPAVAQDRAAALRWFERAAERGSDVGRLMAARIRASRAIGAGAVDARGARQEGAPD